MRHGTRNLNCQVMKWITISLIVLGSGCTQYSLTKEGLSTSMGLKGAILLKKWQHPENCVNEVRQKDRTFYIRLKNTQL
jgi:hypothetical protein